MPEESCATCEHFELIDNVKELGGCKAKGDRSSLLVHKSSQCPLYSEKFEVSGSIEEWLPEELDAVMEMAQDYARDLVCVDMLDESINRLQKMIRYWKGKGGSGEEGKFVALHEAGDAMADMLEYAERGYSTIELWHKAVQAIWPDGDTVEQPERFSTTIEPNYGEENDAARP